MPFANYLYRGWLAQPSQYQKHATWRASLSYVSGSNNLKFGYQGGFMVAKTTTQVAQQLSYTFNNGSPLQLSTRVGPTRVSDRIRYDAFYVQDAWTRGRLTLQGALRFETASSWGPDGENGVLEAHQFGPANIFPRTDGVTRLPRPHAARRRRLRPVRQRQDRRQDELRKVPAGRVLRRGLHDQEPGDDARLEHHAHVDRSRTETGIAQCDFLNPVANLECGPWSNLNWGASVATTRVNPDVLEGWGVRNSDWQFGIGIQHEVLPRMSVDVSYNRRWWNNFFTTHNAALTPADFDEVTLTAPQNPRLPGGGGYPVSVPRAQRPRQAVGVADPYYTTSTRTSATRRTTGTAWTCRSARGCADAVPAGRHQHRAGRERHLRHLTARFGRPMAPRRRRDRSGVVDGQADCDFAEPWLTQARALVSYTLPKVDVLVSGIFRSQPNAQPLATTVATNGGSRTAKYQMTPAQFLAATGVPLRPGLAQQSVDLLAPGRRLRRSHQRHGPAGGQGAAVRRQASERRPGPLQPVQREPADGV